MATQRDRVWAAALDIGMRTDTFRVDDVLGAVDGDVSRRTVQRTLRGMAETGVVNHPASSPNYRIPWELVDGDNGADQREDLEDDRREEPEPDPAAGGLEETRDELVDLLREELPGSGEKLDARVRAVWACYDLLRDRGEVKTATFKEEVYPEHPARYKTADSWWKNSTYSGLAALAGEVPELKIADTTGLWRYTQ